MGVTSCVSSSGVTLNGGVWSLDGSKSLKGEKTTSFSENHSASKRRKSDVDTFAAIKADNFDQVFVYVVERESTLFFIKHIFSFLG